MQIHNNNNINPKSNLTAQSLTPTKNPELADMRKMQDSQKIGVLRRALNNIANAFRAIGEIVTQANSGAPISMSISVKNLGIASNPARSEPLNETGVETLKNHVTQLAPDKKQALVDSAVKDVANGGHNLLKLFTRKPDLFKTVVDAGGEALLHAMDTHSAKIPTKLLSEVSDHMPKYIRDQCVTEGDYGALTADFDKGATKIAGFFEMGVMSLHQALETIKALISTDVEGAMEKTGKDDMGEIFGGIREIVGTHGGAELRDGLAIRKQFEAMSRPGEIAGGVLDGLNSGGSLEDKEFRDSVNQALTAVGISLTFTGEEPNDTSVQKALKVISKQTGAGSGGDAMIFNRLTMPELKELKAMALLPDGQTQIEARLNRYSGATPEAATAIATACMKTFPLKPDQWVAVEELHEQLKTSSPKALESEKVIQQGVKSMFPGGDKGLVKAFEANPALFGTLKDPMSKPVERCIRAFVSDPKNDISPQRAMSIFKALNEGNVSNGKPPTLSEIATDYALKTSESGDSIDFKKLSMTIDSLVRFGLDMDAVGETLSQSSRMGQDNLQPFTEDSAGYLLAAKAILSEHSSPETKRLMAISDSFKYLATKAGDEREFLEQFSVKTETEFLVKVKDSRLIDAAKQKGIKMPENVAEVDARRAELKTSVVTTLEISAALKSITVSSLSTIDGLISSPQDLTAQLRQQITLDAYAPADSALEHLATAKVSDIALAHLAKACIETKTEVGKISEIAQDSNREDMGIRRDAQLAADLWRNVSKLNLSFSSDSTTLLGKEGVGPKPILAALIQHDTGLDVAQRERALSTLAATTFGSDRDVASFLAMIPDDSQTLAVLKMSHQSMEAPVVVHMSTDLSNHFAGMPIPNPAEKQISITMSPDTVGVRIFESYEFRSDQESPKPEFAVGASLNLSLKKGELLQSKLTFPSATSWGIPSVSVEERDAIQSRLNSWGVEMQDVPGPTRVDSAENGGNNITKAALNELRAIVLPDKPSRFSLKGLKQTIENQILRLTKGDRFADRKADKLSTAVATWEKTVLAASDDVGFSSANKEDFKSFLKAEAERYVSQSKNNTPTVANKMTLLLNQLLLRVDLASDLRLNAIDNAPDAVLKMGEGTDHERTYALGAVFAAGSSGMVRSAVLTSADGSKQDVVVKELFVPLMGQTDVPRIVNFSEAVLELLNERALRLDNGTCHPRLAATLDAIVTRDNDGMVKLNICMERLGDSGEKIADSLQSQPLGVRESETKKILKDVGEGLDFMHSKSIMHRDMKPANIAKKEGGYVILDFGAAGRTSEGATDTTITAGSAFFRAPEVMIASKETPYTTAADIFSLGVTAFQMIAGTAVAPAFGERTTYPTGEEATLDQSFNAETLEKAFAKEPWRAVDPELKGFIQKMLNPDPSQRPTAKAVSEFSFGE